MSTIVQTRHNLSTDPFPASVWNWQLGTTEASASTVEVGTGPDGQAGFVRRTTTTAKTTGNSGFYRNESVTGAGGGVDDYTSTLWVRSSVAISAGLNVTAKLGATTITAQAGALTALIPNVWTQLTTTVLNIASSYDTVQSWAILNSAQILPVGATFDIARNLLEAVAATYPYYDGNTPPATDNAYSPAATINYAWDGAAGASRSTMTETAPLQNYQVQLPGAVIVGAGTSVNLLSIAGLRDLSSVRYSDESRPLADGAYPGLSFLGERVLTIKWELTLAAGMESALQILSAAFQNVADPSAVCMTAGDYLRQQAGVGPFKPVSALQLQLPGRAVPLLVLGRPTKHAVPIDLDYQWGQTHPVSEWTSPDGVIYDAAVASATTGLPSPTSGLTWPASFPWTFGSSAGGSMSLSNAGSYPAKPLFVIQGPVSYPKITNTATGQYMYLNITLGAADTLVVDHQAGAVTLNGTANRNNAVAVGSSFFTLAPGTTSIGFSSADSSAVAGALTGYLLPTYSTV